MEKKNAKGFNWVLDLIISYILDLAFLCHYFYFINWLPGHFLWNKMLTFQENTNFVEWLQFD